MSSMRPWRVPEVITMSGAGAGPGPLDSHQRALPLTSAESQLVLRGYPFSVRHLSIPLTASSDRRYSLPDAGAATFSLLVPVQHGVCGSGGTLGAPARCILLSSSAPGHRGQAAAVASQSRRSGGRSQAGTPQGRQSGGLYLRWKAPSEGSDSDTKLDERASWQSVQLHYWLGLRKALKSGDWRDLLFWFEFPGFCRLLMALVQSKDLPMILSWNLGEWAA